MWIIIPFLYDKDFEPIVLKRKTLKFITIIFTLLSIFCVSLCWYFRLNGKEFISYGYCIGITILFSLLLIWFWYMCLKYK